MSEGRYVLFFFISNIKKTNNKGHKYEYHSFKRKYVLIVISKGTTEHNTSTEHQWLSDFCIHSHYVSLSKRGSDDKLHNYTIVEI